MVVIQGVRYSYGNGELKYPDIEVPAGEKYAIIGQSGCGKTTLLHLISGLRKSQHGRIIIEGTDITTLSGHKMDKFRGSRIGMVYQKMHLLSTLTVKQNLLSNQFFAGIRQDHQRVLEVLDELNLSDRAVAYPSELSQGESQRVAIARAIMNKPSLILADEPTSSLDDDNCDKVLNMLIDEAGHYNAALIVVTHDQRVKHRISNIINLNPQ